MEPLSDAFTRQARPTALLLGAAVCTLFLIACGNLGGLLMARGRTREQEFSLRRALGARPARLAAQLLSESLALSIPGALLGMLLASFALPLLTGVIPPDFRDTLAGLDRMRLTLPVAAFALSATLAAALLTGLAQSAALTGARVASSGRRTELLVVAQIALSLPLLAGALILSSAFVRLTSIPAGFDEDHVLTMRVFAGNRYNPPGALSALLSEVCERVATLPGVESAAFSNYLPLGDAGTQRVVAAGKPSDLGASVLIVTPGFFRTLGIPIRRGRDFDRRDQEPREPAPAVVSESLGISLGERITLPGAGRPPLEVVGIVADTRSRQTGQSTPSVYVPYGQASAGTVLFARSGAPERVTRDVLDALWAVDRNLPVRWVGTLRRFDDETIWQRRLATWTIGGIAGLALLLAAVGIYGVIATWAASRRRELGIRAALGAEPAHVRRLVYGRALRLAAFGVAAGLAATAAAGRALEALLFGVRPAGPEVLLAASALLAAIALAAAWLPARRAAATDPAFTLRHE